MSNHLLAYVVIAVKAHTRLQDPVPEGYKREYGCPHTMAT